MTAPKTLFDKTADYTGQPYRNITTLRESEDLFDDLTDGDENASAIAAEAEMRVKDRSVLQDPKIIHRGFDYTRSIIEYPFKNEPYLFTRFGDGTYGVWYGSLEMKTTVFETGFHMIKAERAVEGLDEVVVRERAVYRVKCRAILIDLRGKHKSFPELVAGNYGFTRQIGQRINREGHPGLLAPSSRYNGTNIVIFNPEVLSDPRLHCYLTYFFDPLTLKVRVERTVGRTWLRVDGRKWFE
ncbi:RES family NAD+ phosphorylase [Thermodesulfobacteriota bacterium]